MKITEILGLIFAGLFFCTVVLGFAALIKLLLSYII